MDDSGTSRLDQLPEDIPSKLEAGLSPMAAMIVTAVAAAVQAQSDGEDPHEAALRAVADGAS